MIGCKTKECHLTRNDITNFYQYTSVLIFGSRLIHETHIILYRCINCSLKKFFDVGKGGHRERQGREYSPDHKIEQ